MSRMVGDYELRKKVGEGSYSRVFSAKKQSTNEAVALKMIPKELISNSKLQHNLSNEISIMKKAVHVNITRLKETFSHGKYICLVLELVSGGDLSQFIKAHTHLSEPVAVNLLSQLTQGLLFLEKLGIIHRDLKPQNLLLDRSDSASVGPILKICDFGFARHLSAEASMASTPCGTPLYAAPEIFMMAEYDGKADVWSVGCVFYEMLYGCTPFSGSSPRELFLNIQRHPFAIPQQPKSDKKGVHPLLEVSQQSQQLVTMMLQREPQRRCHLRAVGAAVCKLHGSLVAGQSSTHSQQAAKQNSCPSPSQSHSHKQNRAWTPRSCLPGPVRVVDSWMLVNKQEGPALPAPELQLGGAPLSKYQDSLAVLQVLVQRADESVKEGAAYMEQGNSSAEARAKGVERVARAAALYADGLYMLQGLAQTLSRQHRRPRVTSPLPLPAAPCPRHLSLSKESVRDRPSVREEEVPRVPVGPFAASIRGSLWRIFGEVLQRLRDCALLVPAQHTAIPPVRRVLLQCCEELSRAAEVEMHRGNRSTHLRRTVQLIHDRAEAMPKLEDD